jgi:hypothetical protein
MAEPKRSVRKPVAGCGFPPLSPPNKRASQTPEANSAFPLRAFSSGRGSCSSAARTVTGTKPIGSSPLGFSIVLRSLRWSGQPALARLIHLKTRLAFKPYHRETAATDAPGASASATTSCRCPRHQKLRPRESTDKIPAPKFSPSTLSSHLVSIRLLVDTSVLIQKFLSSGSMDFERPATEAFD